MRPRAGGGGDGMNCEKARGLLAADYTDGELDAAARAEVERHLEACAKCRLFEEELRRLAVEPLRSATRIAAPASLWPRVLRAIRREEERGVRATLRRAWRVLRLPATAYTAASAAAAVIVAAAVFRGLYAPPNGSRAAAIDAEELHAYLDEQYSILACESRGGSAESGEAGFGTLVEEYLM